MTLYKLDHWEHNGYDDSDFYEVVFNDEKDILERILVGSTRFASVNAPKTVEPNEDILKRAEEKLAELIYKMLRPVEYRTVFEMNEIDPGTRVKLLESHYARRKVCDEENCCKCNGSGKWVNPRNSEDKRKCFGCGGSGKKRKTFRPLRKCKRCEHEFSPYLSATDKALGEKLDVTCPNCGADKTNVRIVTDKIAKGSTGTVISSFAHGTFYKKGYNKPNRDNTSVVVKWDGGEEKPCPLSKLRLEREPMTDEQLRKRAVELAKHRNFYAPFRTSRGVSMV